jgi:hypothetical protein
MGTTNYPGYEVTSQLHRRAAPASKRSYVSNQMLEVSDKLQFVAAPRQAKSLSDTKLTHYPNVGCPSKKGAQVL